MDRELAIVWWILILWLIGNGDGTVQFEGVIYSDNYACIRTVSGLYVQVWLYPRNLQDEVMYCNFALCCRY